MVKRKWWEVDWPEFEKAAPPQLAQAEVECYNEATPVSTLAKDHAIFVGGT